MGCGSKGRLDRNVSSAAGLGDRASGSGPGGTYGSGRCEYRATAKQVNQRQSIRTCSAMHVCVRTTKSLPIAQKQAGWSRLQMAHLSVSDEEVREATRDVD